MNEHAEYLASVGREALGLREDEQPNKDQIELLIERTPGLDYLIDWRYPLAEYCPEEEGRGVIYARPDATAGQLCHELMHHYAGVGLGCYLRVMAEITGSVELLRLAEITIAREEAVAAAFEVAMFLPWRMVLRHSNNDLAGLTGWSVEVVCRRRLSVLRWCWARGIDPSGGDP